MNSKETGVNGGRQRDYLGSILQYKNILVVLLLFFFPFIAQLFPLFCWVTLSLPSHTFCSCCFGTVVTFCQRQLLFLCNVFTIYMHCFSILFTNLITHVSIQDCFVSGSKCYFIADLLFYAPANMHQTKYLHKLVKLKTLASASALLSHRQKWMLWRTFFKKSSKNRTFS